TAGFFENDEFGESFGGLPTLIVCRRMGSDPREPEFVCSLTTWTVLSSRLRGVAALLGQPLDPARGGETRRGRVVHLSLPQQGDLKLFGWFAPRPGPRGPG